MVKKQAEEKGFAKIFLDAGFEWREAGCSTCLGMNPDLIPSGEPLWRQLQTETLKEDKEKEQELT